jgi:hypothetical protein
VILTSRRIGIISRVGGHSGGKKRREFGKNAENKAGNLIIFFKYWTNIDIL